MTARKTSAVEVLSAAIAMEEQGKEFFERASRSMTRPRSRDMFISLAIQEQTHVDVLDYELSRVKKGLPWSTLESAKEQSARQRKAPVFRDRAVRRLTPGPEAGELEVIDLGIEIEKRSVEYYRSAGLRSENASAREVFNWLVGQEAGHLTILQAERDSRSGSGFHYDSMEFSLEVE